MESIIFIFTFLSAFFIIYFLSLALVPRFLEFYNKTQAKRVSQVSDKLEDSFIFLEKKKVAFLIVSPFLFAGISFLAIRNVVVLILGFFMGLALPGILTNIIKQSRLKKFQGQLVDSLMILSSSLKGGLSFIQAIEVLVEEMPPPTSQEFDLVLKENKLGVSLEESLKKLRKRMPIEEVNLIVSSVLVARETGGELTKVFSRLTLTIRDNIKLKNKITTLTMQGRMQGIIMSILPVVFAIFIYKQNPNHFDIMLETSLGKMLLVGAAVAQIVGMYLIKRISTLRV